MEVLIATFITSVIAASAFQFYSKVGHQSEVQFDVSEMQHIARISLHDIRKTLLLAGYKLKGHAAFEINSDSLSIYFSDTQPVDTTIYFLQEYSSNDYLKIPGLPTGMKLYYLMKKENSAPAVKFADFIDDVTYDMIDSSNVLVSLTAQVPRGDDTYQSNNGFRKFFLSERVHIRNIK